MVEEQMKLTLPNDINMLIQMAALYYRDGDLSTAADRLQMAAEEMREIAEVNTRERGSDGDENRI